MAEPISKQSMTEYDLRILLLLHQREQSEKSENLHQGVVISHKQQHCKREKETISKTLDDSFCGQSLGETSYFKLGKQTIHNLR